MGERPLERDRRGRLDVHRRAAAESLDQVFTPCDQRADALNRGGLLTPLEVATPLSQIAQIGLSAGALPHSPTQIAR